MKMNELKTSFNSLYDSKKTLFEEEALNEKLASESIECNTSCYSYRNR